MCFRTLLRRRPLDRAAIASTAARIARLIASLAVQRRLTDAIRTGTVGCIVALPGCVSSGPATTPALAHRPAVAITDVTIVDVTDGRLVRNRTVIIRDGRIVSVGRPTDVSIPAGADVVDGRGRYLVPGLADMHVHLYTEGDLFTYVANGITTVRNMAGDTMHLRMRRRVRDGAIIGPRIVTAGPVVEARPLSHPDNVPLENPMAVRAELTRQQAAGYDFVKVYNALARPVYDSVVVVARSLGMPVAGHVPSSVGLDGGATTLDRALSELHPAARAGLRATGQWRVVPRLERGVGAHRHGAHRRIRRAHGSGRSLELSDLRIHGARALPCRRSRASARAP